MQKTILLISLITSCLFVKVLAQPESNYKTDMAKSGEKAPVLREYQTFPTDYSSFMKAKAWNVRSASFFVNTTSLNMSIIGGRVRSTLVDATNGIYLVAPSGGGLWKFTPPTGTPFTPINDFGSFMPITEITQNPFNKQNIIVATGDENHGIVGNGLFQSTNGGNSFTAIASTSPTSNSDFNYIRFVKFSPQTAGIIYLAAKNKSNSWNYLPRSKKQII